MAGNAVVDRKRRASVESSSSTSRAYVASGAAKGTSTARERMSRPRCRGRIFGMPALGNRTSWVDWQSQAASENRARFGSTPLRLPSAPEARSSFATL